LLSVSDPTESSEPDYHLFLDEQEVIYTARALRLLIKDEAHEPVIRRLAREVIEGLEDPPDDEGRLTLTLNPPQMKITHTAVSVLRDDLQRGQAPERDILMGVLDKLPDEHTMRAIEIG